MAEEPIEGIDLTPDAGSDPSIILTPTPTPLVPTPEPGEPGFPGVPVAPGPTPVPAPPPTPVPIPVTPGKLGGLPDLSWLGGLLVILGLILLVAALVDFLNWLFKLVLGPVPGSQRITNLTTKAVAQPLSNFLGTAYSKIDTQIGLSFTTMGQRVNAVGQAILAGEQAAYVAATKLAGLAGSTTGVHAKADTALERAKQAQRSAAQAQTQVQTERQRAEGVEKATRTQLKTEPQHVHTIIEPELEALRHRIHTLEKGATTSWDEIRKHEELLGIGAMTATVAVALGKLGGDWTLCEANKLLGKANCGSGGNSIKNLLEGLLDIAALLELCPLVGLLVETAESSALSLVLSTLVDGFEKLIACRHIKLATPLPEGAYASLAPATGYVGLAPVT